MARATSGGGEINYRQNIGKRGPCEQIARAERAHSKIQFDVFDEADVRRSSRQLGFTRGPRKGEFVSKL